MTPAGVAVLVAWALTLGIEGAAALVALRAFRARKTGAPVRMPGFGATLAAATGLLLATLGVAMLAGTAVAIRVRGHLPLETDDPSEKARALAEGIAAAMNVAALATLAALPVAIAVLVRARRAHP